MNIVNKQRLCTNSGVWSIAFDQSCAERVIWQSTRARVLQALPEFVPFVAHSRARSNYNASVGCIWFLQRDHTLCHTHTQLDSGNIQWWQLSICPLNRMASLAFVFDLLYFKCHCCQLANWNYTKNNDMIFVLKQINGLEPIETKNAKAIFIHRPSVNDPLSILTLSNVFRSDKWYWCPSGSFSTAQKLVVLSQSILRNHCLLKRICYLRCWCAEYGILSFCINRGYPCY